MISTDLSTIAMLFGVFALVGSCVSIWLAARGWQYSSTAWRFVQNENANSVSLKQIAELQTALTELHDAYSALLDSHKKLRSRIGMRELREKRKNETESAPGPGELPDPKSDPEGWKREMRARLRAGTIK